ncbi:DeoR/GlpR transcriptional regulator [Alicyclobacillaceae bacterium I2511]|nr:DeoR/GlpR transcriptional regulator [Alicyclobacillaceae bacterium I2511]
MFADERKKIMLARLASHSRLTVGEICRELDASESTVRRDLQDLEELGLLKRTHGGAVALEIASFEPSLLEKDVAFSEEKHTIAELACSLIQPEETILLDAGTTTLEVARILPNYRLTVVTNSLPIAQELSSREAVQLLLVGGEYRPRTGACVGLVAVQTLQKLRVDRVFLGTNAVDVNFGVSTPNAGECATKTAMVDTAREVVLVADHSKLDHVSMFQVCSLARLAVFVTDRALPLVYQEECRVHQIQVVVPEPIDS